MFTAISSLNLHQVYMDTIANNLANVNTPGFKTSKTSFEDQFSQTLASGAAPTELRGGLNPTQLGLGVRLGAISRAFTQGALISTGRNLDLAVQGDGFFVYGDPNVADGQLYSRDGALSMDTEGYLSGIAGGLRIKGWMADITTGTINTGVAPTSIQIPLSATKARATDEAIVAGNLDASATIDDPLTPLVDEAEYYTATIGVYDSLGALQDVAITFERTSDNNWAYTIPRNPPLTDITGTLTFTTGQLPTTIIPVTLTGANGAGNFTVNLDISNLTQYSAASNASLVSQNGLAAGSVQNFMVDANNGDIYAVYGNGLQDRFGRLALATFVNPEGLTQLGKNMYANSLSSGDANVGWPGNGGKGVLAVGYQEGSNVDLGREFTNMILAERGFQASSRVITTSDEMLQELVNIKR
jgi:flagellar hook protein FlgE